MAAIDGISSISNAATVSYQTKEVSQVKSVEPVNSSDTSNADKQIASQVVTVKDKNHTNSNKDDENPKQENKNNGEATAEQIRKAVDELNKRMRNNISLEFGIHDKTNRVTIKVVDKNSKDVIKEYPAEETLDMLAKVWELAGIIVDEKL